VKLYFKHSTNYCNRSGEIIEISIFTDDLPKRDESILKTEKGIINISRPGIEPEF